MPAYGERLTELRMPVDLVVGALDSKFRRLAEAMARKLPDARVQVIPGAGHNLPLEAPAALAALLAAPRSDLQPETEARTPIPRIEPTLGPRDHPKEDPRS